MFGLITSSIKRIPMSKKEIRGYTSEPLDLRSFFNFKIMITEENYIKNFNGFHEIENQREYFN